jgi:hypothetical protein
MDPEKQPLGSCIDDDSSSGNEDDQRSEIEVTVKKLDGDTFVVSLSKTSTVLGLKTLISDRHNVESELQRLIYRAQELQDAFPLSQYGIQDGATLHLVIRRNQNQVRLAMDDAGLSNEHIARFGIMNAEMMIDVMSAVRLCRFVRIFALIDAVFLLIYGLNYIYFILLAILAVAGYWGAKSLDRKYLIMYVVCLFLEIAVRSYQIYLDPDNIVNVILLSLIILINLFVLRCVVKLYRAIPLLNSEQRERILILNRVGLI